MEAAHAIGTHRQHALLSYWYGAKDPCPPQTTSKRLYAERHGYLWQFEMLPLTTPMVRGREESPQLAETVWHKVSALQRAFDEYSNVSRCTFLDSDTLVVRPQRSLESIFAETRARTPLPAATATATTQHGGSHCSVYLQALNAPPALNAGFISVKRTRWVREVFLPTWLSYADSPRFYFRSSKAENYHAPEQAALTAAVLHFAIRALRPDHALVKANATLQACADPQLRAEHVAQAAAYFREHADLPEAALRVDGLTFRSYMAKYKRPTHRLYTCAAYIFRAALGYDFSQSATIRIDDENSICLLGHEGRQINRHHMLPDWFLRVASGVDTHDSHGASSHRMTGAPYGAGYSRDLLMIHQKGLPAAMCREDWKPPAEELARTTSARRRPTRT